MKFDKGNINILPQDMMSDLSFLSVDLDNPRFGDAKILHSQGLFEKAKSISEIIKEDISEWYNKVKEDYIFDLHYTYELIIIEIDCLDDWIMLYDEFCRVFQVGLYQFEKDIVYTRKEDYCKYYLIYIPYHDGLKDYYINLEEVIFV